MGDILHVTARGCTAKVAIRGALLADLKLLVLGSTLFGQLSLECGGDEGALRWLRGQVQLAGRPLGIHLGDQTLLLAPPDWSAERPRWAVLEGALVQLLVQAEPPALQAARQELRDATEHAAFLRRNLEGAAWVRSTQVRLRRDPALLSGGSLWGAGQDA